MDQQLNLIAEEVGIVNLVGFKRAFGKLKSLKSQPSSVQNVDGGRVISNKRCREDYMYKFGLSTIRIVHKDDPSLMILTSYERLEAQQL
jgi:hypothetical protein